MKKNMIALVLVGAMAMSLCSCGNREPETVEHIESDENEEIQEKETEEEKEEGQKETEEEKEESQKETETEETFSFSELANLQFRFSSGAGGWATMLVIHADGSFSGEYSDGNLGMEGEGYHATMSQCEFNGRFTQPVKVNEYTYSMKICQLDYAREAGQEEIKDGVLYCYVDPYGLDGAEEILIYLPGAPLAELPEEFRGWVGYYDLSYTTDIELPFYALNNEAQQYGFSSYHIVDRMKDDIASTEERAASLEDSLKNDPLDQSELIEKTKELYELWDSALNTVWDALKRTKDVETMKRLTEEEREWIALKEQAVEEAGAGYQGGTIRPMVMNQKAAEMTKDRVYELMELFEE